MEEGGGSNGSKKDIKEIERKVLMSCVMPAYLYGLEMVVVPERQQQRLQFCKNNCVWRIV